MSNIIAVFPASDFIKIAGLTSKDETHPCLKCVNIEPAPDGGCIMVATTGHIMGILRHPVDMGRATGSIMVSTAKDILKATKGSARECLYLVCRDTGMDIVVADNPDAAIDGAHIKATIPASTAYLSRGDFPAWRKVLPEKHSGTRADKINKTPTRYVAINPDLLQPYAAINPDLLQPFAAFGEFLSFDWNGLGAISVATASCPNFYGVIMPGNGGVTPDDILARRAYVMETAQAATEQAATEQAATEQAA